MECRPELSGYSIIEMQVPRGMKKIVKFLSRQSKYETANFQVRNMRVSHAAKNRLKTGSDPFPDTPHMSNKPHRRTMFFIKSYII
jgi:hypothetical protein